jgi:hypothetical protein
MIARVIPHAAVAGLAILATTAAALAQGAASTPGRAASPEFQSGGIKLTVISAAASGKNMSLSLSLENASKENLFLAIIGPPIGINGGNAYGPAAIGGIAYCIYNPRNAPVVMLDRSEEITGCLKSEKPVLTPDTFTLVEAGNAVPVTMEFGSVIALDPDKDFSFSMTVAVFREADLNAPDDNAGAKPKPLPKSLRYLGIGIPRLSLKK